MGSSLASISPHCGVNRHRPLCWLDDRQREQEKSTESAPENCMKRTIVLQTVIISLVLSASSTCYPHLSTCSFCPLDAVFPRRFECVEFFRSHHIACRLADQYVERNFIHRRRHTLRQPCELDIAKWVSEIRQESKRRPLKFPPLQLVVGAC